MPEVIRTIDIAAEPAAVWHWFATAEALRSWVGADLEIDLRVGAAYRMTGADGTTPIAGVVLELDPERRLVLSWQEMDAGWIHPARLLFTLEPTPAGTRVTVQHDGFAGIGTATWERTARAYERGADVHRVLDRLAALVAADGHDAA